MSSTPAPLPNLGLLDGLGVAASGGTDSPAPLPSLGLLGGLGAAASPPPPPPPPPPQPVSQEPLPAAWQADLGFAAAYAFQPLGIPAGNRDEVAPPAGGGISAPGPLPHIAMLLEASPPGVYGISNVGGIASAEAFGVPTVTAPGLVESVVAAIMSYPIEGDLTVEQLLRIVLAAVSGRTTGVGSGGVESYLSRDGSKSRIDATFDADSNRIDVVTDGT